MVQPRSPSAGASARRRYDEGLARWRRKVRLPLMLTTAPSFVSAVAIRLAAPASWQFFAGMLLGGGVSIVVWARDSPPGYVQRWRDGSDGERKTARVLRPLERAGWKVVHDVAAQRANRDHIAVGPGGTFLLDSKAPSGRISFEGDVMLASRLEDFDYRADLGGPARGAAFGLHREIGSPEHVAVRAAATLRLQPA